MTQGTRQLRVCESECDLGDRLRLLFELLIEVKDAPDFGDADRLFRGE